MNGFFNIVFIFCDVKLTVKQVHDRDLRKLYKVQIVVYECP